MNGTDDVRPEAPLVRVAQVRVLYADTDQMGVVNNVNYLRWFEIGRCEWLRARGRAYKAIEEEQDAVLPVIEAQLRYRASARYDDLLDIEAGVIDVKAASVRFRYAIRRAADGLLLCDGSTRHACLGRDGKLKRLPPEVLALLANQA